MTVIDIHTHLPTRDEVTDPRDKRMVEMSGVSLSAERQVETLLDELDRGGIERAVVAGTSHLAGVAFDNEALAADLRPHTDRLIGFGHVDPRCVPEPAAAVRTCVEQLGFRGIGELGGFDITDPMCFPIYETCIELDVPILFHMGIGLPTMPLKYCHPNLLDDVVNRYPELKVIAAHCAAPWFNDLAGVAYRHPNVWIDVSALGAYPTAMRYQAIGTIIGAKLGSRLVFGSDFPVVKPSEWVRWVRGFRIPFLMRKLLGMPKFSAEDREALLHGNARTLLKL